MKSSTNPYERFARNPHFRQCTLTALADHIAWEYGYQLQAKREYRALGWPQVAASHDHTWRTIANLFSEFALLKPTKYLGSRIRQGIHDATQTF